MTPRLKRGGISPLPPNAYPGSRGMTDCLSPPAFSGEHTIPTSPKTLSPCRCGVLLHRCPVRSGASPGKAGHPFPCPPCCQCGPDGPLCSCPRSLHRGALSGQGPPRARLLPRHCQVSPVGFIGYRVDTLSSIHNSLCTMHLNAVF